MHAISSLCPPPFLFVPHHSSASPSPLELHPIQAVCIKGFPLKSLAASFMLHDPGTIQTTTVLPSYMAPGTIQNTTLPSSCIILYIHGPWHYSYSPSIIPLVPPNIHQEKRELSIVYNAHKLSFVWCLKPLILSTIQLSHAGGYRFLFGDIATHTSFQNGKDHAMDAYYRKKGVQRSLHLYPSLW